MDRFGCDRPDVRFGMELVDTTEIVRGCGFGVFSKAVDAGNVVKCINAKGAGNWSRGDIEKLADVVAANGAKGMAWIAYTDTDTELAGKSPIIKFLGDEVHAAIKEAAGVEPGDLLLFAADTYAVASAVLSALRLHMAEKLGIERDGHTLLWVVDFPMFKLDEETKKYAAEHHPFTMIPEADWDKIETDPLTCGSYSYDIVMDGFEMGGGSIRIHNPELQKRVLRRLGLSDADIEEKFGHLIHVLRARRSAARRHRPGPRPFGHASGWQGLHPRRHRLPEDLQRLRPHDRRSLRGHRQAAEGSQPPSAVTL